MTRSWCLAVLLVLLAATATSAITPLEDAPQEDHLAHGLLPQDEEPAARIASGPENLRPADADEEPAARIASGSGNLRPAENRPLEEAPQDSGNLRLAEKKEGGDDAAMPMEAKPSGGVAIQQGGDPGTVPSAGSGSGNDNSNGSGSGEHGKAESGGSSSSGKEAEKSAGVKSCLTKEECHKKRLLCGKGCTLSAHAKCAAKCSKACIPTC